MVGPVRPVAQRFDSRRRARAAERAQRFVGEPPAEQERVVHQVAADLIAGVGRPGHQQQLGVLHGVGGEYVARRGDRAGRRLRERVAGPGEVVDPGDVAVGSDDDTVGDGLVDDAGTGRGGGGECLQRRVLGLRRASRDAAGIALAAQTGLRPADGADRRVATAAVVGRVRRAVAPAGDRDDAGARRCRRRSPPVCRRAARRASGRGTTAGP